MERSSNIDGWIIAGGGNRRMGVDKAALEIGGRKLINIASMALSNICEGRISIAGLPREFVPELPAFPDGDVPSTGPLAGIVTSLSNGTTEWIAVISCDMPFVVDEVFAILADHACLEDDAVVPIQPDERPQPLCSLYRRKPVLAAIRDLFDSDDRSLRNLLFRLTTHYVAFPAFRDLPNAENLFFNINSPVDYERAKDIFLSSGY